MTAYNNNPAFREQVLKEIKRHEELDMFISGQYNEGGGAAFKGGCAIGCTVHSLNLINNSSIAYNSHNDVARLLDVSIDLCLLVDSVFENLPPRLRRTFTFRVWNSIQVGADTGDVCRKMKIWILERVIKFLENNTHRKIDDVRNAITGVIIAFKNNDNDALCAAADCVNKYLDDVDVTGITRAATTAAAYATATAYAAAATAAYATAAAADACAACTAYPAAAYATAYSYEKLSEQLITLLQECEVQP